MGQNHGKLGFVKVSGLSFVKESGQEPFNSHPNPTKQQVRLDMKKKFTIVIILSLVASSLLLAESTYAQSATKPPIPEFTLRYVDNSYDVPPTYGTDPYNGKTVMTDYGEHVDNRTVEIIIKNKPFTSFNDSNGNVINRFYDVRYKGAYTENWNTMFANQTQSIWVGQTNPYIKYGYALQEYSASYTTIFYQLTWQIPTDGQMDFQVEALEGYTYQTFHDGHILFGVAGFAFCGQESGWSNTQTLTFGNNTAIASSPNPMTNPSLSTPTIPITPEPTENQTITPQQPNTGSSKVLGLAFSLEQFAIIALSLLVVSLLIVIAVMAKKRGA